MQAMWDRFGKPGGSAPGVVDVPYTLADAREVLGAVAGEEAFADEFFSRFIEGHEVVDHAELLAAAGVVLRRQSPGQAWLGDVAFGAGLRVSGPTTYGSPLHDAGVDRDDIVQMLDDRPVSSRNDLARLLEMKRPGDTVSVRFLRRGRTVDATLTLAERPHVELVTAESTGATPTARQRAFREDWLGSKQGR